MIGKLTREEETKRKTKTKTKMTQKKKGKKRREIESQQQKQQARQKGKESEKTEEEMQQWAKVQLQERNSVAQRKEQYEGRSIQRTRTKNEDGSTTKESREAEN